MHAYQCRECGRWHVGHIPGTRAGLRKRELGDTRKVVDNMGTPKQDKEGSPKQSGAAGQAVIPGVCAPPTQMPGGNGTTNGMYHGEAGKPTKRK